MQKINLINKLVSDHPEFKFYPSDGFRWSAKDKTIHFAPDKLRQNIYQLSLLHELAHGLLRHSEYNLDIELLKMETEAWDMATEKLAPRYSVKPDKEYTQNQLDSYRDWMHKRSLCPNCGVNGFQQSNLSYKCPSCQKTWRPNEAKFGQLQRRALKNP